MKPRTIGGIELIVALATIIGLCIAVLTLLQAVLANNSQNSFQETQIAILGDMLTLQSDAATLKAVTPGSSITETAISTQATAFQNTLEGYETQIATLMPTLTPTAVWKVGRQIYREDFEDQTANGFEVVNGSFEIISDGDNNVWRTTSQATSLVPLVSSIRAYAVEFRIRQTSDGKGVGGVFFSDVSNSCPGYQLYINPDTSSIRFVEKNNRCDDVLLEQDDIHNMPLSKLTWYSFRIEVKNNEVRVYIDGVPIIQNTTMDDDLLRVDRIGFYGCCDDLLPYIFDFDNIQIWYIDP